jgi:hypothetical protein
MFVSFPFLSGSSLHLIVTLLSTLSRPLSGDGFACPYLGHTTHSYLHSPAPGPYLDPVWVTLHPSLTLTFTQTGEQLPSHSSHPPSSLSVLAA